MTNDAMRNALSAAATLMRMMAAGKSPEDAEQRERLRHWAGQLELTRDELVNREAAARTLIDTFKNWESIQENGFDIGGPQ